MPRKTTAPRKAAPNPLAPLEPLLRDPEVLEIMVDRPDRVLVERDSRLEVTSVKFGSEKALRAAIDLALKLGGVKFEPGQTIAYARLPDDSRVMGVLPPTAVDGPYLVLRKIMRSPMTWERLFKYNAASPAVYDLLHGAVLRRQNIAVAGGPGSGKTTVLNMLADDIPAEERVIVVEQAVELQVRHPRTIRLAAENMPGLTYEDVIIAAARMRPDRLVFGELRGGEVMHILELLRTGHDGSMASIHASNAEDALMRMEGMYLMSNLGLGLSEIRYRIASAFNLISMQRRLADGKRRITEIVEVRGIENDRYVLQPLMRYNPETDQFEMTGAKPGWL